MNGSNIKKIKHYKIWATYPKCLIVIVLIKMEEDHIQHKDFVEPFPNFAKISMQKKIPF